MRKILGLLLIMALLSLGVGWGMLYLYSHKPYGDTAQTMHIARGTSLNEIINILHSGGIIQNPKLFRLYLVTQGIANRVRAGDYSFTPQLTPHQVARMLLEGDFQVYRFTIPEGWTMQQIAELLELKGLSLKGDILKVTRDPEWIRSAGLEVDSLEGYLYPDTYETYYPEDGTELVKLMIDEFKRVFTEEMEDRAVELGLTRHQVVTLASIVEKETGKAEERPLIASVFHNRLQRGMPLQSDPTVIYGIPNFDGNLTKRHLTSYTPYNTYVIPGLPPGPIASPGKEALLAVLYPATSDYLYFVSRNDGSHVFSKSLEEHNRNVVRYQLNGQ